MMEIKGATDGNFIERVKRFPQLWERFQKLEAKRTLGGLSRKVSWDLTAQEIQMDTEDGLGLLTLEAAERRAKEIEAKEAAAERGECKPKTVGAGIKVFDSRHFNGKQTFNYEEILEWLARWLYIEDVDFSTAPNSFAAGLLVELRESGEKRASFVTTVLPKIFQKQSAGSGSRSGNESLDRAMDALKGAYQEAMSEQTLPNGSDPKGPVSEPSVPDGNF